MKEKFSRGGAKKFVFKYLILLENRSPGETLSLKAKRKFILPTFKPLKNFKGFLTWDFREGFGFFPNSRGGPQRNFMGGGPLGSVAFFKKLLIPPNPKGFFLILFLIWGPKFFYLVCFLGVEKAFFFLFF